MFLTLKMFKAINNNNTHNILNKDYCLRLASSRVDFKTRIKKRSNLKNNPKKTLLRE